MLLLSSFFTLAAMFSRMESYLTVSHRGRGCRVDLFHFAELELRG